MMQQAMKNSGNKRAMGAFFAIQFAVLALLLVAYRWLGPHPWSDLLASGYVFKLSLLFAAGAVFTYIGLQLVQAMHSRDQGAITANLRPIRIDEAALARNDEADPLETSLQRLDDMTGLQSVKDEVKALVARIQVEQRRSEAGLNVSALSQHMVFSGAPGVGKTEVARILGDVFKALKVVRKGHVVEVDRASLVAGYVGQTAIKTREKCQEALDGILFIDEAYTLVSDSQSGQGFGQEAIDTLLKFMEDNRSRIVVIAAGYPEQMQEFVNANPGLASRFTKKLHFGNYSQAELTSIFFQMARAQQFQVPDHASELLAPWLEQRMNQSTWANAREVRTLLEKAREEQAMRIARTGSDNLLELTTDDLIAAIARSQ